MCAERRNRPKSEIEIGKKNQEARLQNMTYGQYVALEYMRTHKIQRDGDINK